MMRMTRCALVVLTALVTMLGAVVLRAQEPAALRGELLQVDTDAMTLAIKTDAGAEFVFRYNADTKVTGSQAGIAGLATKEGAELTVHFEESEEQGQPDTAIRIEIHSAPRAEQASAVEASTTGQDQGVRR